MGFRRDSPKIYDSVDVVRVANEMKLGGVKNLSSTNTYHTHPECKVRFWCCGEVLEEAIWLVDAIGLNCVIWRVREDKAWRNQLVVGV